MNRREFLLALTGTAATTVFAALTGCAPPNTKYYFNMYKAKNVQSPDVVHCFTSIGHKRGTQPFILGGTCCCTPSEALLEMYHEDGVLLDYDLAALLDEYDQRGIVLAHDNGWQCNNLCDHGPHVVFGGTCMVPPTLGTQNWENVITGKRPKI